MAKKVKLISAEKLPKLYKKTYTEKNFEKKIIKCLYIEEDKETVQKLFKEDKDKKGNKILVLDKTLTFKKDDFKRLKQIAKEINAQKGGFKIVPFAAAFIATALLVILFCTFKNVIIKKAITSAMQNTFGARTDIAKVDFGLFSAKLDIRKLEQANKDKPMKNLFSIDQITVDFQLTDLLRGKCHIENIAVDGVALDTDRTYSGELKIKPSESSEEKAVAKETAAESKSFTESAADQLKAMFADYNPEKMLSSVQSELKSPAVASQISTDVKAKVEKWQKTPDQMKQTVTEYSSEIQSLINTNWSKVNDPAKIADAVTKINNAIENGKDLGKTFDKTISEINTDSKDVAAYQKQLSEAVASDKALVDSKVKQIKSSFTPEGFKKIMNDAAQSMLYQTTGKYYPIVSKALAYASTVKSSSSGSSSKTEKKTKKSGSSFKRLPGRTIYYKKDNIPSLLIEKITVSGKEYHSDSSLFTGFAKDISSDMDRYGKPASAESSFTVSGNKHSVKAVIDARTETPNALVTASYNGQGFGISGNAGVFDFESKSDINAQILASSASDVTIKGTLDMHMNSMKGMEFEPAKVSALYSSALNNVNKLTMQFTVHYTSDGMMITIDNLSQLSKQLSDPVSKALTGELSNIASETKASITKTLSEKTGIASEQISKFTDIKNSVNSQKAQLDKYQKQLQEKLNQAKKQAANAATDKAKDAASNALKKLF